MRRWLNYFKLMTLTGRIQISFYVHLLSYYMMGAMSIRHWGYVVSALHCS
jgi:hypothetical protein